MAHINVIRQHFLAMGNLCKAWTLNCRLSPLPCQHLMTNSIVVNHVLTLSSVYAVKQSTFAYMFEFDSSWRAMIKIPYSALPCVFWSSIEGLEKFAEDFLSGAVKQYVKSEKAPEKNDGPVKVSLSKTDGPLILLCNVYVISILTPRPTNGEVVTFSRHRITHKQNYVVKHISK